MRGDCFNLPAFVRPKEGGSSAQNLQEHAFPFSDIMQQTSLRVIRTHINEHGEIFVEHTDLSLRGKSVERRFVIARIGRHDVAPDLAHQRTRPLAPLQTRQERLPLLGLRNEDRLGTVLDQANVVCNIGKGKLSRLP